MNKENHIPKETFELIEQYLENELSGKSLSDFEALLKTNPKLKRQVEEVKYLTTGIERAVLLEKMKLFHDELQTDVPVKPLNNRNKSILRIAIAASFVIGIGLMWLFNQTSPQERLYQAYFSPDPGLPTVMSSSEEFDFYDAMVDYKRNDYKSAYNKWLLLYEKKPNNDTLQYFIGMTLLAIKEEDKAFPYLKKVENTPESVFYNDALYYKALYYIKANNIHKAKENLLKSSHPRAKDLLDEMKNL